MKIGSLLVTDTNFNEHQNKRCAQGIIHLVNPPTPEGVYTCSEIGRVNDKDVLKLEESICYIDGGEGWFVAKHFKEVQAPGEVCLESLLEETILEPA